MLVPAPVLSPYGQQQLYTQRAAALQGWYAALANRHYARCNVVVLGDSITEGQGATVQERRWVARLRDRLRARLPTAGITAGGGRGYLACANTGESSYTWPATVAGSPATVQQGPKSLGYQLASTGQAITYSSLTGDSVDVWWVQVAAGGTFSYAVDGGGAVSVSTAGSSTVDGKLTHVPLGAGGQHTLTLAWVSGNADVTGITEFWGDYSIGIHVHDAGHFGWQTSNWTGVPSGVTGPNAAIAALNPAAVIIALGVNDQFSNVASATYQASITTIISNVRAQLTAPYPPFILLMYPPRSGQGTYTYAWSQYVQAAWAVAAADTSGVGSASAVTVLDMTLGPRMLGADVDVWGLWHVSDLVHPSDKGHALLADVVAEFLTPA
jgi:lysophospholipase L1-like esterase